MKIQIYGSGCDKCKMLYANAEKALQKTGLTAELEKVTDMNAIVEAGILITPALVIDGKTVAKGKVLTPDEIVSLLGVQTEADVGCNCSCGCSDGCSNNRKARWKRILALLLLLLVATAVGTMIYRENAAPKMPESTTQPSRSKNVLFIYYFHGNQRCFTCNKIEALAKRAIEQKYSAKIKDGSVVFRSINVDEPENEHFIKDFALDSKIVVMQRGDRVEKFPEVWQLVHDEGKFTSYLQNGAEKLLP